MAKQPATTKLTFDVSTGLKSVLGRELITDDEVAIFELVKNSFDAGATAVHLYFGENNVVVADNGNGMSFQDLKDKWLFVAYSAKKKPEEEKDFRDLAAERTHFAGSKGIGRFSSDRLGEVLTLQTRAKTEKSSSIHQLVVNWGNFEKDNKAFFDKIPLIYSETPAFGLPNELAKFEKSLSHGTVIEIAKLRRRWNRNRLRELKASLAKLINPFGDMGDKFKVVITAPSELDADKQAKEAAKKKGEELTPRDIINGPVGNFIFSELQRKTTFIKVSIQNDVVQTTLTDRGELIYKIEEPNPYKGLSNSGFTCELYYLNQSAKVTFARRIGLPSVQFGSVLLFRNGFRVYPIGDEGYDWFGFDRRKQQGYARFLGSREIIGRVDVYGSDENFQEASSRNQGLIETAAVLELKKAVMDHCLKRLEKYVVPVSWVDKADGLTEDLSRLLTDPGKARVSAAVASLVDNEQVRLLEFSRRLVDLLNERSGKFEESLVSIRSIAEKTNDKELIAKLDKAEKRFEELKKSETEARLVADKERAAAEAAEKRAESAQSEAKYAKEEADTERRRSHFLESVVTVDKATILNLHHQVTIYAVDIAQQIENLLSESADQMTLSRDTVLRALEQMAFLNRKVLAITKFAARAKFTLDSGKIHTDFSEFITDYIEQIAKVTGGTRLQVKVENTCSPLKMRFNPIDASIIVDNLISNSKRAKATTIRFELSTLEKKGLIMRVSDNGRGLAPGTNSKRIFEMGYTTTQGSGLGLYHVRQVLGEIGGSIEFDESRDAKGASFLIKVLPGDQSK